MLLDLSEPRLAGCAGEAVERAIAEMFFEGLIEPAALNAGAPDGGRAARAVVRGTLTGMVDVHWDARAEASLASNFLGAADAGELTDEARQTVLCELANICCGSLLSRLDPGGRFDIETPRLVAEPLGGPWLRFVLECGVVCLAARLEEAR